MENEFIATNVLHLMKRSIKRMFILLIVFIVLFVASIVDSIYQRCRIIDILEDIEVVEEVETYEMNADGNNNFIGGDNNGEVNN
jgi:hypothetical protein